MTDFRFRDKHKNGFSHTTVLKFDKGDRKTEVTIDRYTEIPYHNAFGQRNCYQKKCYSCDYAGKQRISDLTLASFWNIERYTDMYDTKAGVSMVLVSTNKGKDLFKKIIENSKWHEHPVDDAFKENPGLVESVCYPAERERIMNDWVRYGYKGIRKHYIQTVKGKIAALLPPGVVEFAKKILHRG
jgi:coenzyme F420-reducing hydrogenase beta subunit